ncbi:hypothetical protein Tco_0828287 [Tanacetum coccineum]
MLNCSQCRTQGDIKKKLEPEGDPVVDPTLYCSLVSALYYLTFTGPDLPYSVQQLCLNMHDPREQHLYALRTPSSRSNVEVEYIGVANVVAETACIRNLLPELPRFASTTFNFAVMETPSSSRRITRTTRKFEESENGVMKSRSVLIDITNDSPIVGLAIGNLKTPSSTVSKKRLVLRNSESIYEPGLGEALLRDQVKTLLQKVEEEAVISKISFEPRNFVMNSPMCFCPPTPANTPQLSENNKDGSEFVNMSPVVVAESFSFSQILDRQEDIEETVEKHLIAKLFTPLPEEIEGYESSLDDKDDASVWSMQVNASICDELEDFEEFGAN